MCIRDRLTDAKEQRRRFTKEMDERQRSYGDSYPLDEDFLHALSFMPQASGIALGFDRLVMLVCGAPHIEPVSYTHLDVYKRQRPYFPACNGPNRQSRLG